MFFFNSEADNAFESIKHVREDGSEFWSARELYPLLDYKQWRRFDDSVRRAKTACESSRFNVSDHFADVGKMVDIGSGAGREVDDYELSRYACYLIVQNGDPRKEAIALGQTYFAVQTRRQELADQAAFDALGEDEKRLLNRRELREHNRLLAIQAQDSGVKTPLDYATFQNEGYKGLYNGENADDIHARKGLKKSQDILDFMGHQELAANLFRASQTEAKLKRDGVTDKRAANRTHKEVGQIVRQAIADIGGTMPEELPTPAKSIKRLELEAEKKRIEQDIKQMSLDEGE